jgi:hypothetical protein
MNRPFYLDGEEAEHFNLLRQLPEAERRLYMGALRSYLEASRTETTETTTNEQQSPRPIVRLRLAASN